MAQPTVDRLATLYRISQTFSSSLELDDVLNLVMDEVISITRAERGFLMLREPNGELAFRVARGFDRTTIESPEFEVSRGLVDRVAREGKPILTSDAQSDEWLGQRKSVRGLRLRAVLGVPLQLKGICNGVIYVDNRLQTGIFSKEDIELLEGIASSAAIAIENARLYQVAIEKGRLERELQVAREVQSKLIPQKTPQIDGWEFSAWWQPARQVSGDFYDFIPLNETHLGIVIADVTDKGMPAALFMADSRSLTRASVSIPTQPANAIASANRLICADSANGMFVSLFYGKLDIESGNLTYVNAGHNPPYLYQAETETFSEFERTGLVLGIESEAEFKEQAVQLKQGDFILLYTDGVTEATNTEQDLYGKDRLLQLLYNHRKSSVNEVQAALEDSITEFIGDISPSDDITMVIAKRI